MVSDFLSKPTTLQLMWSDQTDFFGNPAAEEKKTLVQMGGWFSSWFQTPLKTGDSPLLKVLDNVFCIMKK
jgi:hypothetical protein